MASGDCRERFWWQSEALSPAVDRARRSPSTHAARRHRPWPRSQRRSPLGPDEGDRRSGRVRRSVGRSGRRTRERWSRDRAAHIVRLVPYMASGYSARTFDMALPAARNPYTPGAGQTPSALTGRDQELDDFAATLSRLELGRSAQCTCSSGCGESARPCCSISSGPSRETGSGGSSSTTSCDQTQTYSPASPASRAKPYSASDHPSAGRPPRTGSSHCWPASRSPGHLRGSPSTSRLANRTTTPAQWTPTQRTRPSTCPAPSGPVSLAGYYPPGSSPRNRRTTTLMLDSAGSTATRPVHHHDPTTQPSTSTISAR